MIVYRYKGDLYRVMSYPMMKVSGLWTQAVSYVRADSLQDTNIYVREFEEFKSKFERLEIVP